MFVSHHQQSAINTADRLVDYDLCGDFRSKQVSSWPSTNLWLNFFLSFFHLTLSRGLLIVVSFNSRTHHNFFTIFFSCLFYVFLFFIELADVSKVFFSSLFSFLISFQGKQNTFPFTLRARILAHELTTSTKVFIKWIFLMTFNKKREASKERRKKQVEKEDEWKFTASIKDENC